MSLNTNKSQYSNFNFDCKPQWWENEGKQETIYKKVRSGNEGDCDWGNNIFQSYDASSANK